jgi:hypothetical protein
MRGRIAVVDEDVFNPAIRAQKAGRRLGAQ